MTARLYRSTDSGAPSLTGAAGAGLSLLDAVLVNGYNSKTVTITRSGATATATCVGHGFASDGLTRVVISGAGQTEYNIETTITNVTANTFDYVVAGSPATPATGTITAKVPSSGWSKAYTGTNIAAYKQAAGQQRLFRVDDSAAQSMRVIGVESMGDIDTYLNPMPPPTVLSGGQYWHKSNTANSTARPWVIIATEQTVWIYVDVNSDTGASASVYGYGDFTSQKTSDPYNQFIIGASSATVATSNQIYGMANIAAGAVATTGVKMVQRPFSGFGQAAGCQEADWTSSTAMFNNTFQYPNPANSAMELNAVWLFEGSPRLIRGVYPGIWTAPYSSSWATHLVTFSGGTGALSGKKFMYLKQYSASGIVFEISNTW